MSRRATERDSRIATVTVTEWEPPTCSPEPMSLAGMAVHDAVTGEVFIRLDVDGEQVHLRPSTMLTFASRLLGLASDFRGCRWNLESMQCESPDCLFEPGPKHLGRRGAA